MQIKKASRIAIVVVRGFFARLFRIELGRIGLPGKQMVPKGKGRRNDEKRGIHKIKVDEKAADRWNAAQHADGTSNEREQNAVGCHEALGIGINAKEPEFVRGDCLIP